MKYQDGYLGTKTEFADFVKKAVPELFSGKLVVEGKPVSLPSDATFDYKVKYDEGDTGGSVSIKVSWDNENVELDLGD